MRYLPLITAFMLVSVRPAVSAPPHEIVGVALGMNPDEARKAILATGSGWEIAVVKTPAGKMDTLTATKTVNRVMVESILVWFNAEANTAWYVGRQVTFAEKDQPLVDTTRKSLIAKYGAPSTTFPADSPDSIINPVLMWSFDPAGAQIGPLKRPRQDRTRCVSADSTRVMGSSPNNSPTLTYPGKIDEQCGVTALAQIGRHFNNHDVNLALMVWVADQHARFVELQKEKVVEEQAGKAANEKANQKAQTNQPKL